MQRHGWFSVGSRRGVCSWGGALGAVVLVMLGVDQAAGQSTVEIDRSSIAIEPGSVFTFQFQASAPSPDGFTVEASEDAAGPDSWVPAGEAEILPVADGRFRVVLAMPGARRFCRVSWLDPVSVSPPLLINEVMSDNVATLADGAGDFWDWIEIYNPNDEAVGLDRYALTDDDALLAKWRFPALFIQPYAHLLVYASDLDRSVAGEELHTNFKLKAAGETLTLSDAALRPLDRYRVPALAPDQSVGRAPDGGDAVVLYSRTDATPGGENRLMGLGPEVLPPTFTPDGGFFAGPVTVQIQGAQSDHVLHVTLDGSPPTPQSQVLSSALTLNASTVVRVLAVDPEGGQSAPEARTFMIGVDHELPVVSLATDPSHLGFRSGYLYGLGPNVLTGDNQVLKTFPFYGSYAWEDREVEVALEFFETHHTVVLRQRAGLKVFGGWGSRGYPQKSLALFARRAYGAGAFNHRVFPDESTDQFEALVLRNSGNDNQGTHQTPPRSPITQFGPTRSYGSYFVNGNFTLLRDAFMQRLVRGTNLDTQAYRPAVVYLNGQYWGIYNLREKMNEQYVLSHHAVSGPGVDLIEGYGSVRAGDDTVYRQMMDFLRTENLADDVRYDYVAEHYVDIENAIDYHLAVIYFQNFDIGNIKCWRPRGSRGRFRWMLYDQDYGFDLWPPAVYLPAMARDYGDYENMFEFYTLGTRPGVNWPNGPERTLLLRSLLKNPGFKERFIRRCADLLNSAFREDRVDRTLQEMASVIRPEMPAHLNRWSWRELIRRGYGAPHQTESEPFTPATWETNLAVVAAFGAARPARLRQDCLEAFGLNSGLGVLEVRVEPGGSGRTQVNTLTVDAFPWQGIYFADIPNTLRPLPDPGYRFVAWHSSSATTSVHSLTCAVHRDATNVWVAEMEPAPANPGASSELVITEIQYHPADASDSGDWIELYHAGTAPLDLSGWILRDEVDEHAWLLPEFILQPGALLVLTEDDSRFRLFHPATVVAVGDFRFGLGNGGDTVRLFRPDGTVAVVIAYDNGLPWPAAADGGGATLQLVDPRADPTRPGSWRASPQVGGSPGAL